MLPCLSVKIEQVVGVLHKVFMHNQVNCAELSKFMEKSYDSRQVSTKHCDITVSPYTLAYFP